jgi:hypothetical protein
LTDRYPYGTLMVEVMEMRQNQNRQVQQVNQVAWPTTLYLTPDRWSPLVPVHVVDAEGLHWLIDKELKRAPINAQLMDATPIRLVETRDDNTAIYRCEADPFCEGEEALYRVRRYRYPKGWMLYEWERVCGRR